MHRKVGVILAAKSKKKRKKTKTKITTKNKVVVKKTKKKEQQKTTSKAVIGSFGSVISFVVSEDKLLTFSNMEREFSARWTTHSSIQSKEKKEFVGRGSGSITMEVVLDKAHGIEPRKTIGNIEKAINKGTVEPLIIGGKQLGANKYAITSMSETWDVVMLNGYLARATVRLTFEGYA